MCIVEIAILPEHYGDRAAEFMVDGVCPIDTADPGYVPIHILGDNTDNGLTWLDIQTDRTAGLIKSTRQVKSVR